MNIAAAMQSCACASMVSVTPRAIHYSQYYDSNSIDSICCTFVIDRVAGAIIRLVASVCVRVCVRPFVCGHSLV